MEVLGNNSAKELLSIVHRIERLEEERKDLNECLKDLFSEAKSKGFEAKAIKVILKQRKARPEDVEYLQHTVETYQRALQEAEA